MASKNKPRIRTNYRPTVKETSSRTILTHRWLTLKRENTSLMQIVARRMGLGVLAALLLSAPAKAAFQDPFQSPQSVAMGGISLPAASDPAALFTNAAGIHGLKQPEAYFSYTELFAGLPGVPSLSRGFSAAALPTKRGTVGVGIGIFDAAGLMQERTVTVGFAKTLSNGVTVGVAGKHLYHGFRPGGDPLAANDPVFRNGISKSAFAFDAGAILPVGSIARINVAVRNINQPDVGLATKDPVRREFQTGVTFTAYGMEATGDLFFPTTDRGMQRPLPAIGVERKMYDGRAAFRFGLNENQFSAGVGVKAGKIAFDYAWVLTRNLAQDNSGSHTIGVRMPFGGKR